MISIIICFINENLLREVKSSISKTIGCTYEIIAIDNRLNEHSIFTAYNAGALNAKYETLCFVHEDIEFFSNNWGIVISNIFETVKNVGLIGSCGAVVKTEIPTSWVDIPSKYYVSGLIGKREGISESSNENYQEVVVIDGLFMATTKSIWHNHPFPARKGFHGYDLLYSLQLGILHKIVVATGIKILHKSRGNFNKNWFEITLDVHKEFERSLPRFITKEDKLLEETYRLNSLKFVHHLHNSSFSITKKAKLVIKYILLNNQIAIVDKAKAMYYLTRLG